MTSFNHKTDWFYEGNVSNTLVNYLEKQGYTITKHNSFNVKARGVDIIAEKDGFTELIEVKGYPSRFHTKGGNKGKPKVTKPDQQAKHWFSEVIMTNIFNYGTYADGKKSVLAIALPLHEIYKKQMEKVTPFFVDNKLFMKVYFIDEGGNVTVENLNNPTS